MQECPRWYMLPVPTQQWWKTLRSWQHLCRDKHEYQPTRWRRYEGHTELRFSHQVNIWAHEASGFSLTDPGWCSCNNSLRTRDIQKFQEEPGTGIYLRAKFKPKQDERLQFTNDPLHDAEIVHHFDKRNEEDDRSKLYDTSETTFRQDNQRLTVPTKNQCLA